MQLNIFCLGNNNKTTILPNSNYGHAGNGHLIQLESSKHALKHSTSMPARHVLMPVNTSRSSLNDTGPVANSTLSNQIDNHLPKTVNEIPQPQVKVKLRKRVTAPILRLSGFAMVNNKKNMQNGIKTFDTPIEFQRPDYMAVDSDLSSFTSWDDSDAESVPHSTEMARKNVTKNRKKRNSFHLAYMNVNDSGTMDDSHMPISDNLNTSHSHSYVNIPRKVNPNSPDVIPHLYDSTNADNLQVPVHRNQSDELPEITDGHSDDSLDHRESTVSTHIYETIDSKNIQEIRAQKEREKNKNSPIRKMISKVPSMSKKSNKTIKQSGEIGPDIILSVPPIKRSRNSASTWEMVATPALVMIERKKAAEEKELETIAEDIGNRENNTENTETYHNIE